MTIAEARHKSTIKVENIDNNERNDLFYAQQQQQQQQEAGTMAGGEICCCCCKERVEPSASVSLSNATGVLLRTQSPALITESGDRIDSPPLDATNDFCERCLSQRHFRNVKEISTAEKGKDDKEHVRRATTTTTTTKLSLVATAAAHPAAASFSSSSRTCSSVGEESNDIISAIGSPLTSQKSAQEMTPVGGDALDATVATDAPAITSSSGFKRHNVKYATHHSINDSNHCHSSEKSRKSSGIPSSESMASSSTSSMMGRYFIGSLIVNLPEGTILKCIPADETRQNLTLNILKPGDSLLNLLHGKGAQTLLLNAFCGHSKRRMYARLKWGSTGEICACEFLCEFSMDTQNEALRIANIQIFCIDTRPMRRVESTRSSAVFTTRHNSSCAVIYLDSASIPILGHFPSEITGKSLFALIHADDVNAIKQAHHELRQKSGGEIIATPGLKFRTYQGGAVRVNSEWSAFVNPWTRQVEMIVGRHVLHDDAFVEHLSSDVGVHLTVEQLRQHDADVYNILSKPTKVQDSDKVTVVDVKAEFNEKRTQSASPTQFSVISVNGVNATTTTFSEQVYEQPTTDLDENNNNANEPHTDTAESPIPNSTIKQEIMSDIEMTKKEADLSVKTESNAPDISLSYNQINCLENVHRLLKSQAKTMDKNDNTRTEKDKSLASPVGKQPVSIPLTKELLEMHDRKWENECKYNWKKRLAHKRLATNPPDAQIETKIQRTVANSHTNSSSLHENLAQTQSAMHNANAEIASLPSQSSNNSSDISIKKRYHEESMAQNGGHTTLNEYLLVALQAQLQTLLTSQQQKAELAGSKQKLHLTPQTIALMNGLFIQYKQRLQQNQLQ